MRACTADAQERGHVGVQGFTRPGVAVGLGVDGPAEEGPPVAIVIFDVVSGADLVVQAVKIVPAIVPVLTYLVTATGLTCAMTASLRRKVHPKH
jgi:hypothetical protein